MNEVILEMEEKMRVEEIQSGGIREETEREI